MSSAEHERLLRRARAQDAALFRYRLIGPALEEGLSTKQRGKVVRGIAGQVHAGPGGRGVQVSRKTIDRWIRAWRKTPQGFDLSNRVHPGLFAMKSCQGTLTLPAGHVPDGPAVRGRGSLSSGHAALSASGVPARWDHAVASSYSRPVFRHPCRMPARRLATRRIASSWPVSRARRSS